MRLYPTVRLLLVVTAMSAMPLTAQQPQPQTQQSDPPTTPTPHGQILFDHHEPAPANDPQAPSTPPPSTPTPGISSSQQQPHTLRRRTPADATTQPDTIVEAATSSQPEPNPNDPILITTQDRAASAQISNTDRASTTITATALDIHLNTHTGDTETRAQLTLRNTGTSPLTYLPLRISGALHWESARLNGTTIPITQHHLPDDLDHTGVATELALTLLQPLAPGASATLDLYYAGTLTTSTLRLLNLGAPADRALLTDWDTVSDTFTGLRGLGNVLWYPVTEPPALLNDGPAVPQTVEQARLANAAAPFRLHLTLQYTGTRPAAAFFCGERTLFKPLSAADSNAANEAGAVIVDWDRPALGPHTPSLFIAQATPHTVASGLLRVVTDRADTAAAMGEAAARIRPMLADWLGVAPPRLLDIVLLNIIDLPIPGAAGFTDGSLLVTPLTTAPAAALAPALVGPLTNAWLPPDIAAPWLRDGIPAFLQAVWAERTEGRTAALTGLAATRTRLSLINAAAPAGVSSSSSSDEPAVTSASQPLATCTDPACARAKAAYVFEMLRTMLGDAALQQALSGWRISEEKTEEKAPQASTTAPSPQQNAAAQKASAEQETANLESLLQQVAGKRDLRWFFQSWVDADHGLPELSIVTVAPRRVERNAPTNYLPPRQAVGGPIGPEPVPLPGDPDSIAKPSATPGDKIAPAPGSWLVAVEVQNTGDADAEVPVTVRSGNLTNTLPLRVPAHGRATIRVPFEAEPEEVLVNDGTVPETRTSQHRRTLTALTR